ncbi:unnamed protein product [Meganyctiphanes norvegica]|uniref:Uncharacterized protein n=1 Tax=Meganyctiphanes norvegica TaxID=48144 RepID=A0AAV2Q8I6_MEGNR
MRNASGATITWDCFEPRHMAFYVVSVFKNKSKRSLLRKTSKSLTCSLELRQDDLIGALVEIEACLDQKHCSTASSLILKLNYKERIKIRYHKSEKMGLSFTTFIILTSILMLLLMVILYVLIQRMEDTNNMSLITTDTMAYDEKMKFIYGHYD